jgi:hypothetical protein
MFWRRKKKEFGSNAAVLRKMQADLFDKEKEPGFLTRLSNSMNTNPEPYEWILMILKRKESLLSAKNTSRTQDEFQAWAIRQAEIAAEVRLLRSLSKMAIQAQESLRIQSAMTEENLQEFEIDRKD